MAARKSIAFWLFFKEILGATEHWVLPKKIWKTFSWCAFAELSPGKILGESTACKLKMQLAIFFFFQKKNVALISTLEMCLWHSPVISQWTVLGKMFLFTCQSSPGKDWIMKGRTGSGMACLGGWRWPKVHRQSRVGGGAGRGQSLLLVDGTSLCAWERMSFIFLLCPGPHKGDPDGDKQFRALHLGRGSSCHPEGRTAPCSSLICILGVRRKLLDQGFYSLGWETPVGCHLPLHCVCEKHHRGSLLCETSDLGVQGCQVTCLSLRGQREVWKPLF